MKQAADRNSPAPIDGPTARSAAYEGSERIAEARDLARSFLTELQDVHGIPVPHHVHGTVQLVVSELVTNSRKYAPGPCLVSLETDGDAIEVAVWDSEPRSPVPRAPDPFRVGQHGLEIVTAVCDKVEVRREPVGKRITAEVALTGAADQTRMNGE